MESSEALYVVIPLVTATIVLEYAYGAITGRNTYRLTEASSSVALGFTSLIAGILFSGVSMTVYGVVESRFGLFDLSGLTAGNLIAGFLFYDFLYYWAHRWNHEVSVLWAGHLVHHSGEDFNYTTAVRLGILPVFLYWIFFLPMAVLGLGLEVFGVVYTAQLIYQHLLHTEHVPKLGILERVLYTPSQHRVHHSRNSLYVDKNYACFLSVWDRWFGTFQEELDDIRPVYGVAKPLGSFVPEVINYSYLLRLLGRAWQSGTLSSGARTLLASPGSVDPAPNATPSDHKYDPIPDGRGRVASAGFMLLGTWLVVGFLSALPSMGLGQKALYLVAIVSILNSACLLFDAARGRTAANVSALVAAASVPFAMRGAQALAWVALCLALLLFSSTRRTTAPANSPLALSAE